MSSRDELLAIARGLGATVVENAGALVVVVPPEARGVELVRLERAAEIAATSQRVLKDAIRAGDLVAFGRERDRSVRRADLEAWIVARQVRVDLGPDDDRIERRVKRLERERRVGGTR